MALLTVGARMSRGVQASALACVVFAQLLSGLEASALKNRSILVVGDGDDFVRRGGMIRLATAQNRIRLIINLDAAKAASLTISSQLLRSADIVTASKR